MAFSLCPVAPGDTVRVAFQDATHEGKVCAVKAGCILVDVVVVGAASPVLCVVYPDAIVDVIRRAA